MRSVGLIRKKKVQEKGLQLWQTRSHATILYDSVPADCIEKVVSTNLKRLFQKTSTPRPPPKIILKEAWQVQRDTQVQRGSDIGKPIADEEEFKIDLSVQGVQKSSPSR